MAKVVKTVKVKLRLTSAQEKTLLYQCSLVRYVFNWGLSKRIEEYKNAGISLNLYQQSNELTIHKQLNTWLYDASANSLQHALRDVDKAFKNFFEGRTRYPRFKAKNKTLPSIRYPKQCSLKGNRIRLPKLGWIRCFNSHEHGKVKSVTVKQTPSGDWYATCVTEFEAVPKKPIKKACGIDLGLKDLAVITDGNTYQHIEAPKFFRQYQQKLAIAQKNLSRKKAGSANRAKAKLKVAKLHQRIVNLRTNFLHQLTNKLANTFDLICLEDLSLRGMARTRLAKSVLDAALGEFVRQLEYKTLWRGGTTQKIDRFFPSSKLHAACGMVNKDLTLSDRTWVCGCGETVNRDQNAALNILIEGLSINGSDSADLWSWSKSLTMLDRPTVKQESFLGKSVDLAALFSFEIEQEREREALKKSNYMEDIKAH